MRQNFLSNEWFDCTEKLSNHELLPHDSFLNVPRNSNPFEKGCNDCENLFQCGLSKEQALAKLKMDNVPITGADNYACLQNIWDNEHLFAVFLKW